jgi:2,3,4,5-tetrahydropyridine-2-carboxylate N-succinyltransferase
VPRQICAPTASRMCHPEDMRDPASPELRLPSASTDELRASIEAALADKRDLPRHGPAVREVIDRLDRGALRVAEKGAQGWIVHGWVQSAINLYFGVVESELYEAGALTFFDKIPPKRALGDFRLVPPGVVRYGAHVEKGAIVMPGYVNIGARVGSGSMVDTWATVGSCAQVGRGVHLSGGVGLGGVLEPPGARPVIIEDGAFVGSRCIVVEGVLVEEEAVLGAGVVLTASTPVYDVTGTEEKQFKGLIPARSVVIPGMRPRRFPAGEYLTPCALIIGTRSPSTDRKTSLNAALRDFGVPV